MSHWYAARKDGKTEILDDKELEKRVNDYVETPDVIRGYRDALNAESDPNWVAVPDDLRAGKIRPSAFAARRLAAALDAVADKKYHVMIPPVYPVHLLCVPSNFVPDEKTAFGDLGIAMRDDEFKAAMARFEHDLARRSVTHAVLCELPRTPSVDLALRARPDGILLNADDASARTLVFVLWREPVKGEPPRIDEVDEPVSPRRPASIMDPSIVWADTADEHDALVDSDPERYQERLVSDTALACFGIK